MIREDMRVASPRRWRVLVGPRGELSCARVGDPLAGNYRRDWAEVARFNLPRGRWSAPAAAYRDALDSLMRRAPFGTF